MQLVKNSKNSRHQNGCTISVIIEVRSEITSDTQGHSENGNLDAKVMMEIEEYFYQSPVCCLTRYDQ